MRVVGFGVLYGGSGVRSARLFAPPVNQIGCCGTEPVSSLCFKTGNENIIYASHGNEIKSSNVYMLSDGSWKPLESYSYNKYEVNQVVCNGRSSFLASADDSGDVKVSKVFTFFQLSPVDLMQSLFCGISQKVARKRS
ncbi:unnamed protein product [Eruca vesicaria subsp. sativa]|uniref:Uncharacterized protein n=1 Tax=Eruca vesicaria subsp. sativa TaxID=29727 RepID=A0ABC8M3T9_ERUVS|nr:unnamed protein product [Eruca vesicaria subsp. sativa]